MLLAGFIVLVIAIAFTLEANQLVVSAINAKPHNTNSALWDAYWAVLIIGYSLGFAGVITIIFGFITRNPPVQYNNIFTFKAVLECPFAP